MPCKNPSADIFLKPYEIYIFESAILKKEMFDKVWHTVAIFSIVNLSIVLRTNPQNNFYYLH